jgi:hypothetical protein
MAKEPKLLAEIRANAARVGKAASRSARRGGPAQEPTGPNMSATVETLATPNAPNNYIAEAFAECTTLAHCRELLAHAKQHGYSDDGQTVQLLRKRIAELGHAELTDAQKPKRSRRSPDQGARR